MERKQALTFEAEVKDGVLVLPEDYRDAVQGRVSVILLLEENQPSSENQENGSQVKPSLPEYKRLGYESYLDYRIHNPYRIPDFKPMSREEVHERDG